MVICKLYLPRYFISEMFVGVGLGVVRREPGTFNIRNIFCGVAKHLRSVVITLTLERISRNKWPEVT